MGAISVRELNANISKVLARVEAGEMLDITRNSKVIAELRPKGRVRDAAWWKAYDEGVALLRKKRPGKIGIISQDDKYGDADL